MNYSEKILTPTVLVLAGAVILSFSSVFVELSNTGPTVSGFYRLLLGGVILIAVTLLRNNTLRVGWRPFLVMAAAGAFFALDLYLWHRSILIVGPGLATILGNFQVFFVALFAILFLGNRLNWRIATSIPVALAGLFLIVGLDWDTAADEFKWGVWLGLFTALSYAGYLLTLNHSRKVDKDKVSSFTTIGIISLIAGLLLGVTILVQGHESFAIPDRQTLFSLIGLALMIQVIGWVMISKGLPEINVSLAALLLLLQPALAFIWDMVFFNRPTSGIELIGAGITLAAIYLGTTGKSGKV